MQLVRCNWACVSFYIDSACFQNAQLIISHINSWSTACTVQLILTRHRLNNQNFWNRQTSKLYWSISIIKQKSFSWKSYLIWFDNFWSGYQAENRIVLALVSPASSLIKAQLFKQLRRVIQWNPYNFWNVWMKWTHQILMYRFFNWFRPKSSKCQNLLTDWHF